MNIGIYGLGRFGAFWASELSESFTVRAFSRRTRVFPPGVQIVSENEVLECDVVILCVAISAMEEVLMRISPDIKPGTLVMDTCSIKEYPVAAMKKCLPASVNILATHPMFGPDSAQDGIEGKPMILCPIRIEKCQVDFWENRFYKMGLRVIKMTPKEHDHEAAFTQGIVHYLGRVLAEMGLRESLISTVGYLRLQELVEQTCNDSHQLFLDLQRFNPFTKQMRNQLEKALKTVKKSLDSEDERNGTL